MAKPKLVNKLSKKLKTNGLFLSLGFISIFGFLFNTISLLTGKDITGTFMYSSVLLGIGLIFESKIKSVLNHSRMTNVGIMKIITFAVGSVVLLGGLLTIPFLNITLSGAVAGAVAFANIIAILVIMYEVFLVD